MRWMLSCGQMDSLVSTQKRIYGVCFFCLKHFRTQHETVKGRSTARLGITMLMITKQSLSLQNIEPDDCLMPGCDFLPFYPSFSTMCVVVTFKRLF